MNLKILICRWIANRIEIRSRAQRRILRDYHRHEIARISVLEMRVRGLRLYAAWSQHLEHNKTHPAPEPRSLPQVPAGILGEKERAFC